MHLSNLLLLPLLLQGVAAAPTQDATTAIDASDSENVIAQSFTASDGETYEILINAAFVAETADSNIMAVQERQVTHRSQYDFIKTSDHQDLCRDSSFNRDTGPNAPTTGRCRVLQDWASNNRGYFQTSLIHHCGNKATWLMKTHPGGTGACAFWVRHNYLNGKIGNTDVRDLIRDSLSKFTMNFNGVYRVRSWGVADCRGDLVNGGRVPMTWWVDNE